MAHAIGKLVSALQQFLCLCSKCSLSQTEASNNWAREDVGGSNSGGTDGGRSGAGGGRSGGTEGSRGGGAEGGRIGSGGGRFGGGLDNNATTTIWLKFEHNRVIQSRFSGRLQLHPA